MAFTARKTFRAVIAWVIGFFIGFNRGSFFKYLHTIFKKNTIILEYSLLVVFFYNCTSASICPMGRERPIGTRTSQVFVLIDEWFNNT